jgi:hypothetical protein
MWEILSLNSRLAKISVCVNKIYTRKEAVGIGESPFFSLLLKDAVVSRLYSVDGRMINEYGAVSGTRIDRENRSSR